MRVKIFKAKAIRTALAVVLSFVNIQASGADKSCQLLLKGLTLTDRAITKEVGRLGNGFVPSPRNLERLKMYDEGPELLKLQSQSLRKSLSKHGAEVGGRGGRQALESVSADNRIRWGGSVYYEHVEGMQDAEDLIANLDFAFVRNSHHFNGKAQLPILSSKQLQLLGLEGGMNTASFNSKVMGTDDNVFFFVLPIVKGYTRMTSNGMYGNKAFNVDSLYAQESGWISLYVMYPNQLLKAVSTIDKSLGSKLRRSDKDGFFSYGGPIVSGSLSRLIENSIQQLYQTDFTVQDFREMIRNTMLINLAKTKDENPKAFDRTIEKLRSSNIASVQSVLSEYVYEPMGFSFDDGQAFEFKIPVAVPQKYVSRVKR